MKKDNKVSEIEVSYRLAIERRLQILSALDVYTELLDFFSPETLQCKKLLL